MIDSTNTSSNTTQHSAAGRRNPYVGPRPFQTGEQLYGRDRDVRRLINLLIAERIVLLHSPSGAGKTSLIQAALMPRLQAEEFDVLPIMRVNLVDSPGSQADAPTAPQTNGETPPIQRGNPYILSLLLSLEEALPADQQTPIEHLAAMTLVAYLERRFAQTPADESPSQVLIFDQFEEILTTSPTSTTDKIDFFVQVGVVLRDRRRWALFAMREDYIGGLEPYLTAIPTRFKATFRLDLLTSQAARLAIQEPARLAHATFTDEAATRLVDDLRVVRVQQADGTMCEQPGLYVEPVQLQVVCYRLWEKLPPDDWTIDEADIVAQGDVNTALADYYAECVNAIAHRTGVGERTIREWCNRHLITPQGLRGQVLQSTDESAGLPNHAIAALIDAHLVRSEKRRGATWFELAHDRLIEPVRTSNEAWFEQHLTLLQRQATLWEQRGRPDSLLLRGQELKQAEIELQAQPEALTPVERDFLTACVKEHRQNQLRRRLTIFSVVVAVIAIAAAFFAWRAGQLAQAKQADFQNLSLGYKFADLSTAELNLHHAPLSLLLAVEANEHIARLNNKHLAVAEEALRQALATIGGVPLNRHKDAINAVAFDPQGHWLASGSADGTVLLWDVRDPRSEPLVLGAYEQEITSLVFHPTRQLLAAASSSGIVWLWDVNDPDQEPLVLHNGDDMVTSVAFSSDGQWLVAAGKVIRLWNMAYPQRDPRMLSDLSDRQALSVSVAFSVDGQWLAASFDAAVSVWDMADLESNPVVLRGHEGTIRDMAFSPNGRWLATVGDDATVRLWGIADTYTTEPLVLRGHERAIKGVAFSPDGQWLATAGDDTTVRLWQMSDVNSGPRLLTGHKLDILKVAFSPNGQWLASASLDTTVRFWNMADLSQEPLLLTGHNSRISDIAFSADEQWFASASDDGSGRLWSLPITFAEPMVLQQDEVNITRLAYQPGGTWLATASSDGVVRLWDASNPTDEPLVLHEYAGAVTSLQFSARGRWLAAVGVDTPVWLWDMANPGAEPVVLDNDGDAIQTLTISPEEHWLATLSTDGTVRLWDIGRSGSVDRIAGRVVSQDSDPQGDLVFSADGQWLATVGKDGRRVWFWDPTNLDTPPLVRSTGIDGMSRVVLSPGLEWAVVLLDSRQGAQVVLQDIVDMGSDLMRLPEYDQPPDHIIFSADGRWLLIAQNNTIELWDMQADDPLESGMVLRGQVGTVLDTAFSPDGIRLAVTSSDGDVRLWKLESPTSKPVVLTGHSGPVNAVAFSSDGRRVVTAGDDGTVRIWRVKVDDLISTACEVAGRNISVDEWEEFLTDFDGDAPYNETCPDLSAP